jgi:NRPS condensation-like uncharacterized protein
MKKSYETGKMNSIDRIYFAMEDVVTSQGQLVVIRFQEAHSVEEIRRAFRHMFTLYPRMRSFVEPTFFAYRLRILDDDDRRVGIFFNDAFRVQYGLQYESEAYIEYRRNLYNEPFSLEQGFPIKIRYLPDDPRPVLLLSVHHMICDGIGWLKMADSLMAYLNGGNPPVVPIGSPSLYPAVLEKPWYKAVFQIARSARLFHENMKKPKPGPLVQASSRPANFFGPIDMHLHCLSPDLQMLITRAKSFKVSLTVLLMTALTITLSRWRENVEGEVIGIIMPIDLRQFFPGEKPVFGNFATIRMLLVERELWSDPAAIMKRLNEQLLDAAENLKQKKIIVNFLIDNLMSLIGRKNLARGTRMVKERGLISKTVAFSNLGNVNYLNTHGENAKICEAISTTTSHGLFIAMNSVIDEVHLSITYQEAEFSRDEIKSFVQVFDQVLDQITGNN